MKATKRPSAESDGRTLPASPWRPPVATLTRSVRPVRRSRTNTSSAPLVSPGTRLVACELKATKRPSVESAGKRLPNGPAGVGRLGLTRSASPIRSSASCRDGPTCSSRPRRCWRPRHWPPAPCCCLRSPPPGARHARTSRPASEWGIARPTAPVASAYAGPRRGADRTHAGAAGCRGPGTVGALSRDGGAVGVRSHQRPGGPRQPARGSLPGA